MSPVDTTGHKAHLFHISGEDSSRGNTEEREGHGEAGSGRDSTVSHHSSDWDTEHV